MKVYLERDTALIKATITKNAIAHSPATSTKITIWAPDSDGDAAHTTMSTSSESMTESSTGVYIYNYDTTGNSAGVYSVMIICKETTTAPMEVTREDGEFELKSYPG